MRQFILTVEVQNDGERENHFQAGFDDEKRLIEGMGDLLDLFKMQGVAPALATLFKVAEQMPGVEKTEIPR